MEAVRSAIVVKSLGASALLLLVLALAACGNGETKSDEGGVSIGRETAGAGSPAGSESDLVQSSEGALSA